MDKENPVKKEIAEFAAKVREELQHLDAELIAELVSDLEANVAASVDDGGPIPDASEYVAELLTAAGLDVAVSRRKKRLGGVLARVRKQLNGLAPMWWFVRAFIAVVVLSAISSNTTSNGSRFPLFRIFGSSWTALVLFVLLLWASVYLGRQQRPKPTKVSELLGVGSIIVGLVVGFYVADKDFIKSQDWVSQYNKFCADGLQETANQFKDLPDFSTLPNVMGMTASEAEKAISKWSNDTVGMMFQQDDIKPMMDYEDAVAVRQDSPQLHDQMCAARVIIPVWFENRSSESSSTSLPSVIQPGATSLPPEDGLYVIQQGDSPQSIALRFGITVAELLESNGWETETQFPYPDTVIKIPAPASNR
jgi:LysM repeat protein